MNKSKISILISSYNRKLLFRRSLFSIAMNPPAQSFEVIVADDGSTENIVEELENFSPSFKWQFIKVDHEEFAKKTGLKKFHNCPALTNNIAFRQSEGEHIFTMGNEIIAYQDCFNKMINDIPKLDYYMVMSTTYDLRKEILDNIGEYGQNLTKQMLEYSKQWPLQSKEYRSDVTNYISLCSRKVWEEIGGYNEQYCGGISSEDSDFVRRARKLENFDMKISDGISLHQSHGGRTKYYETDQNIITTKRFNEGVEINHKIYYSWNNSHKNPQEWEYGTLGIKEIIKNF